MGVKTIRGVNIKISHCLKVGCFLFSGSPEKLLCVGVGKSQGIQKFATKQTVRILEIIFNYGKPDISRSLAL